MLSYETRSKLGALFLSISTGEQEIELHRQALCRLQDFEPYAAFQRIVEKRQGSPITSHNIRDFLVEHKIYHSINDCEIFIKRFDNDGDFGLSYKEFLYALLPTDNPHLRSMTAQRMNYRVSKNQVLKNEVEEALARLIDKEISFYLNRDLQKSRLMQQKDFTYEAAFSAIDKYHSERIDYDNLKSFLEGQAMYPTKQDLIAILRKVDNHNKGFISLEDLIREVNPTTDLSQLSKMGIEERSYKIGNRDIGISTSAKKKNPDEIILKSAASTSTHFNLTASETKVQEQIQSAPFGEKKEHAPNTVSLASTQIEQSQKVVTPIKSSLKANSAEKLSHQKISRTNYASHYRNASISTLDQTATKEKQNTQVVKVLDFNEGKEVKNISQFDMNRTNVNLISIFKQFLVFAKELEIAKEELALQQDFNIFSFFKAFEPELNVYITPNKLLQGLKKFGVFPNYRELELLFKTLDKDEDGMLRICDFEEMMLSIKYEFSIRVRNRAPFPQKTQLEIDKVFSSETRRKIHQVLSLKLENEGLLESLKKKLNKGTTFDLRIAFDQLDIQQEGFVTFKTMKCFLESNNWFITNEDLTILIDIFDLNKDGKVSYAEFVKTLSLKNEEMKIV